MRLHSVIAAIILTASAVAQCPSANQPGTGPDIPNNVQLQGQCLVKNTNVTITSWYNNTPGQLQITFGTTNAADTSVNLDVNHNYGYSGPAAQRIVHNNSLVTSHTIVLDHIPSGRQQLLIPGDCDGTGNGSYYTATNCGRFDSHGSVGGYSQSAQTFGYIFTSPAANASHPTLWEFMPSQSTEVYQGHALNVSLVGNFFDGAMPTWIVAKSLTVDGGNCPANVMGAPCSGVKLLFMDNGAEIVGNGKNGYNPTVATVGQYTGSFEVGGSQAALKGYVLNMPGAVLRIATTSATALGTHCVDGVFQGTDGSYNNMGSTVPVHYCFTVLAPPTLSPTPPTSFTPIPSLAKFNTFIANQVAAKFNAFKVANTTFPGKYNNDAMSATQSAVDPWAMFNYGGGSVAFQIGDYIGSVAVGWQAGFNHAIGDMVNNGNCVLVAMNAGTSGSVQPACPTPGASVSDGSETWNSAGNVAYWKANAQRVGQQSMNWQIGMSLCCSGVWQEWNLLTQEDTMMDYFREGGALAKDCNGSGACTGVQQRALEGLANPVYRVAGANNQGGVWTIKSVPEDTIRTLPYFLDTLNDMQLLHNAPVVNSGWNEALPRVDLLLQSLRVTEDTNPIEDAATNPYPCCVGTPTFDFGLVVKALIRYCTVQVEQGGQCDPIIPTELLKFADFYWSHMVYANTSPYNVWAYPGQTSNGNQLNMLFAPVYAWLFAYYGNGCTLPTSGVACTTASNQMALHALDSSYFPSAKQMNQIFEWWGDWKGWLGGTQTWQQTSVLRGMNPNQGTIPNQLEPYNGHSYPVAPSYTCQSSSCSITWASFEKITIPQVWVAVDTGHCPTSYPLTATGGSSVFMPGTFTQWMNSGSISGLAPATTYCYGVGGTDAQGNLAFSTVSPISGQDYTLLTANGPPIPTFNLSITPNAVTVAQGRHGTATLTTTISSGFNSQIMFTASRLPDGVTFSAPVIPAPGAGSTTMTLTVAPNAKVGTYPITITGSGGGLQRPVMFTITVKVGSST